MQGPLEGGGALPLRAAAGRKASYAWGRGSNCVGAGSAGTMPHQRAGAQRMVLGGCAALARGPPLRAPAGVHGGSPESAVGSLGNTPTRAIPRGVYGEPPWAVCGAHRRLGELVEHGVGLIDRGVAAQAHPLRNPGIGLAPINRGPVHVAVRELFPRAVG